MGKTKILRDFSGWTSAHGIPHIGSAQNSCLRAFWTIIFIASTGMFIFQMVLLIDKYTSYDVTVQTELKFEERTFPAVTVCNLNPYSDKKVNETPAANQIADLMEAYQHAIDPQRSNTSSSAYKYFVDNGDKWEFTLIEQNDSIALQSKAREHLLYLAADLQQNNDSNSNAFMNIIYDYPDFIRNCAYNTRPCKNTKDTLGDPNIFGDFKQKIDPIYGACYTFNWNHTYKSTRAGPLYGLRLLLQSAQDDYLPLTESAGVRVAVHGQEEEPFPDAFGYNAAAGFTTSFGIKYIRTKRLPAPYGNCTSEDKDSDISYFYDGDYTVEGCFRSCFQEKVTEDCGCSDPRFNLAQKDKDYCLARDSKTGNSSQATGRDCINKYSKSNNAEDNQVTFNAIKDCSCPQPCIESTYGVTVSTALWPSDVYTPPDCKSENRPGGSNEKECSEWYSENTMLIEVYYERMNYQELSESEAYTLVNLVSDMGGQLGLWMGISVITVVEFFSLCVLLCLFCLSGNKDSSDEVQPIDKGQYGHDYGKGQTPPPPYHDGHGMDPYATSHDFDARYGPPTAPTPS